MFAFAVYGFHLPFDQFVDFFPPKVVQFGIEEVVELILTVPFIVEANAPLNDLKGSGKDVSPSV